MQMLEKDSNAARNIFNRNTNSKDNYVQPPTKYNKIIRKTRFIYMYHKAENVQLEDLAESKPKLQTVLEKMKSLRKKYTFLYEKKWKDYQILNSPFENFHTSDSLHMAATKNKFLAVIHDFKRGRSLGYWLLCEFFLLLSDIILHNITKMFNIIIYIQLKRLIAIICFMSYIIVVLVPSLY